MSEKTVPTCGHPDRKHRAKGKCNSCYVLDWTREHPDANTGNNWLKDNPERAKYLSRRATLKKHGITPEDYEAMWQQQEGKCANLRCQKWFPLDAPDYRKALQVDHCHESGKIRALLCPGCNVALGHIDDDQERLLGLIQYIHEFHVLN